MFWASFFGIIHEDIDIFELWLVKYWLVLLKLHSSCPEQHFVFRKKMYFFDKFQEILHFFGLPAKIF